MQPKILKPKKIMARIKYGATDELHDHVLYEIYNEKLHPANFRKAGLFEKHLGSTQYLRSSTEDPKIAAHRHNRPFRSPPLGLVTISPNLLDSKSETSLPPSPKCRTSRIPMQLPRYIYWPKKRLIALRSCKTMAMNRHYPNSTKKPIDRFQSSITFMTLRLRIDFATSIRKRFWPFGRHFRCLSLHTGT